MLSLTRLVTAHLRQLSKKRVLPLSQRCQLRRRHRIGFQLAHNMTALRRQQRGCEPVEICNPSMSLQPCLQNCRCYPRADAASTLAKSKALASAKPLPPRQVASPRSRCRSIPSRSNSIPHSRYPPKPLCPAGLRETASATRMASMGLTEPACSSAKVSSMTAAASRKASTRFCGGGAPA